MNPEIQLVFGCLLFGLSVAWTLWAAVRDDLHALERLAGRPEAPPRAALARGARQPGPVPPR
jgi:hypothetical protein